MRRDADDVHFLDTRGASPYYLAVGGSGDVHCLCYVKATSMMTQLRDAPRGIQITNITAGKVSLMSQQINQGKQTPLSPNHPKPSAARAAAAAELRTIHTLDRIYILIAQRTSTPIN